MKQKKVTFADVAKYTGFSKTTISRYFNKPESITAENKVIIENALSKLNYQTNKVARILANGRTELLGIILPSFYFQFYSVMVNQIINTYNDYGYKFIVFLSNRNADTERKCITELQSYNIEGIINFSHEISSQELAALEIPVVAVEREDRYISSVSTNSHVGACLAVEQLQRDGCEVLLHLNSPDNPLSPTYQRITGFETACKNLGCEHEVIYRDFTWSFSHTVQQAGEIADYIENKYPRKKCGLFCANDTLASACLNVLYSRGIEIPGQYEIIGFDNSPLTEETIISISTIGQDIEQLTDNIMKMMLRKIEQKHSSASVSGAIDHVMVSPSFVGRQTTLNR